MITFSLVAALSIAIENLARIKERCYEQMTCTEKLDIYIQHKSFIHTTIKNSQITKPLWRKLFWSTGRDSDEYKTGCVDIYLTYFPELYTSKQSTNKGLADM